MARQICIKPCGTLSNLAALTVPMMGGSMQPNPPSFSITGDCPGCTFSMSLMAQLNVFLSGLGIPLCVLGCIGSIVQVVQAIPDSLGPPPDPGKLLSAIANVVVKCECVLQFVLPPPIGAICQFLVLIAEVLALIAAIVDCLISLIQSLLTLNIKAGLLISSDNSDVQAAGQCMSDNTQLLMDNLGDQMGGLKTLYGILQPVLSLLDIVPGLSDVITPFMAIFKALVCGIGPGSGINIAAALTALMTFETVVDDIAMAVADIAAICPPSSPPVC